MTIIDAQGNHHHGKGAAGGHFANHDRSAPETGLEPDHHGLTAQTPLDIDTALSEVFDRAWKQRVKVDMLETQIRQLEERLRKGRSWFQDETLLPQLEEELVVEQAKLDAIQDEAVPYEREFARRGGWSRAFLVTGGHLHRSMDCSTCNRDGNRTRFNWMPEYSGQDEEQIVDAAGSRVCTVCYPSAPVDVLSRPSRMLTPDEADAQAARERRAEEKKAREADRAAKALLPDGSELRMPGTYYRVKTLASARIALTDAIIDSHIAIQNPEFAQEKSTWRDMLIDAIAAKTDQPVDAVRAEAYEKARKKMRREWGSTPNW